jgi:hypothetical protein
MLDLVTGSHPKYKTKSDAESYCEQIHHNPTSR